VGAAALVAVQVNAPAVVSWLVSTAVHWSSGWVKFVLLRR
jgi:hypothetical protein